MSEKSFAGRNKLKEYFKNNTTPTEDEFAALIDSSVNQEDDNIYAKNQKISIGDNTKSPDATLSVNGKEGDASFRVKTENNPLIETDKNDRLNIYTESKFEKDILIKAPVEIKGTRAKLDIDADGEVKPLQVKNKLENGEKRSAFVVRRDNKVGINKDEPDATLDIDGDAKISESLSVGGINDSQASVFINQKSDQINPALDIKTENVRGEKMTQLELSADGNLGLGTKDANAKLHIYQHPDDKRPIVRVDDNTQDDNPFIIDSEGKVGIGVLHPNNKLDVNGSVLVGKEFIGHTVPDNSIIVEKSVGINMATPKGNLHIEASRDNAILVNRDDKTLLRVTKDSVSTDNDLEVKKDANIEGKAEIAKNLSVAGDTGLSGDTQIGRNLNVKANTSLNGTLTVDEESTLNKSLDVKGKTTIHEDLQVEKNSSFKGNSTVNGNMDVVGNTQLKSNLNISGKTRAKNSVEIDVAGDDPDKIAKANLHVGQSLPDTAALRIDQSATAEVPAVLVKNGKVGIHTDDPKFALDVKGKTDLKGVLDVNEILNVNDKRVVIKETDTEVNTFVIKHKDKEDRLRTSLIVRNGRLGLGKDKPEAKLDVNGKTKLDGNLNVNGISDLAGELNVESKTTLNDTVEIAGETSIKNSLDVQKSISVSLEGKESDANIHVMQSDKDKAALRVDSLNDTEGGSSVSLIVKDNKVGINNNDPKKEVDVTGSVEISGDLTVKKSTTVDGKGQYNDNVSIKKNLNVNQQVGIAVTETDARLHIATDETEDTAIKVNDGKKTSLIFKDNKMGIGTDDPQRDLDVKGDAFIDDELMVQGRTILESTLDVGRDTLLKSDLTVLDDTKMVGRVVLGTPDNITGCNINKSQLYIADSNYNEALRIESPDDKEEKSILIIKQGKLGIGTEAPEAHLDVQGSANIAENLDVRHDLEVRNNGVIRENFEVDGSLTVAQRVVHGSDTRIKGDLFVEDKTTVEEDLYVQGDTELEKTTIKKDAYVNGELEVEGRTSLKRDLTVDGLISSGTDNPQAQLHVESNEDLNPILVEKKRNNGSRQTFLKIDGKGNLGIGTTSPMAKLDLQGSAKISENIDVSGDIKADSMDLGSQFSLANGPQINKISTDVGLGDLTASDQIIPTQRAIKTYIDNVATAFGSHGQTITISNQEIFDSLFNQGPMTELPMNSTILLLPLKDSYDDGNERPPYILKNSVKINSGVSIIGFNSRTTRVVKESAFCRFELVGTSSSPVRKVNMEGWVFDGKQLPADSNGGAFYLKHVRDSVLNCHIVRHETSANGGAIYGEGCRNITAHYIRNCHAIGVSSGSEAQRSKGGAAVGLMESSIKAVNCSSVYGGAVANCNYSVVVAKSCKAEVAGGAAYRSENLRLTATKCNAGKRGGAAYFCSDMICDGFWRENNAPEGPNIYASNNQTGENKERHYWKGDYVGRRIDNNTRLWRADNE